MQVTESRRIIINTLAAYVRSVVTLPLNLLGARWILAGLGKDDFGVYSVVGGLVFFITFINGVMTGAVARFYAYAIGQAKTTEKGMGDSLLRSWFNVSVLIHIALPGVLIACYPLLAYVVRHWLVIPDGRMEAAIWTLRFSILTAIVSFVNVPFSALFAAHQWIVELTVYALALSVMQFLISLFIPHCSGDRLVLYAGLMFAATFFVLGVQNLRAYRLFPSARLRFKSMLDLARLLELLKFVGWRLLSGIAYVARAQGSAMVTNVYFGPSANAAYSIGNQLSAQAASLSQSLINALTPATTTSEGAGTRQHTLDLAYRSCKFSSILVLLFAIPLTLEIDEVLKLWLSDPPDGSAVVCVCMLGAFVLEKLTVGQYLAIMAHGKIAAWQSCVSALYVATMMLGWGLVLCGINAYAVAYAFLIVAFFLSATHVYFAKKQVDMAIWPWVRNIVLRVLGVSALTFAVGWLVTWVFPESFLRLCLTTAACGGTLIGLSVFLVFSGDERNYLRNIVARIVLWWSRKECRA